MKGDVGAARVVADCGYASHIATRDFWWKLVDRWHQFAQRHCESLEICSAPRGRVSPVEGGSTRRVVDCSGSWRAVWVGNQPDRSLVTKAASGRLSNLTGRNVSEAWAGLESRGADADPPAKRGRPRERGSNRHMHPSRSAGV